MLHARVIAQAYMVRVIRRSCERPRKLNPYKLSMVETMDAKLCTVNYVIEFWQ
jgi:hypothetical protein